MRYSLAREFKACWLIALLISPNLSPAQPPRVDDLGDPMPEGAIARLGSARLFHVGRDENRGMSIFSPDGELLATVTLASAKIWEAHTGRKLGTIYLPGYDSPVAAFSSQSRSIAVATGGMVGVFPAMGDHYFNDSKPVKKGSPQVEWLAFLPQQAGIAFIENHGDICVTDVRGAEQFRIPHEATRPVAGLSIDGKTLTIWNQEHVDRWDLSRRARVAAIKFPYLSSFTKLRLRADGSLFALAQRSGEVLFWDPASQKETGKLAEDSLQVDAGMEFTPDGKQLVTVTGQETTALVRRWDVATGKLLKAFSIPLEDAGDPAVSPDNKSVAFTTARPAIPLWNLQTGKRLFDRGGLDEPPVSLSFAPGGKLIATGGRQIRTWDATKGKLLNTIALPFSCAGLAVDRSGEWGVAVGVGERPPQICSFMSGELGSTFQLPPEVVIDPGAVAIAQSNGTVLALGRTNRPAAKVRLVWDRKTGRLKSIERDPDAADWRALAGPFRLRLIRSEHQDQSQWDISGVASIPEIGIYSLTGEQPLATVQPAGDPDRASSNGRLLALLSRTSSSALVDSSSARLEVWEIASGERLRFGPNAAAEGCYSALTMSPDGRALAVVNGRAEIALIETYTGRKLSSFAVDHVRSLAFSHDGCSLASGQDDGTILIWDVSAATRRRAPTRLATAPEFDQAWRDLARDAAHARVAMDRFSADSARAIEFFHDHLKPASPLSPARFHKLIADLDAAEYATREAASHDLANYRNLLRTEMQAAHGSTSSLEARRRIEKILAMPRPARTANELRQLRAIELLEGFDSHDARDILRLIASGDPRAPQTQAASAALKRLQP